MHKNNTSEQIVCTRSVAGLFSTCCKSALLSSLRRQKSGCLTCTTSNAGTHIARHAQVKLSSNQTPAVKNAAPAIEQYATPGRVRWKNKWLHPSRKGAIIVTADSCTAERAGSGYWSSEFTPKHVPQVIVLDAAYAFRTRVHCVNTCVRALSEHMREHSVFMNTK